MQEYDLVVIGSGPGGQRAAIAAAKLGRSVAVIERGRMLGGVCVNTGTIPSKTLREAVVYLTGMSQRELYGASYRVKDKITPADLLARTQHVIGKEIEVVRSQLMRNRVEMFTGHGRFVDEHTVVVEDPNRAETISVRGRHIVLATGTVPARPNGVAFDDDRVLDSDGILELKSLPASMVVVGAGVIGIEYASMFAALGTKVTVVEKRDTMLEFCDPEIIEALRFHLRDLAVTFRFGEEVTAVDVGASGTVTSLVSGKRIPAETVMYSAGRQGQTEGLGLAAAGLVADDRGRIAVDALRRTFERELTREQKLAGAWREATADLLNPQRCSAVLAQLLAEGSLNKSGYAQLCALSPATASKHLVTLAERGLLVQSGKGPATRYTLPA